VIHLECPGCAATFSVSGDLAGKTGKCPTCATQFTIPDADAPAGGDAGLTPPEPASEPVEVQPCPGCQARIAVTRDDLGTTVECPYCLQRFVAESPEALPRLPRTPQRDRPLAARHSRRREEAHDEVEGGDDRPRRRRRSKQGDGPTQVGTIGVLLLVGGGVSFLWTLGTMVATGGMTCGICCLWPGFYLAPVWGVFAIVRGAAMMNGHDWRVTPPTVLHVLQILLVLNFDVINLTLGIVGLVLSNHEPTRDYYAQNFDRSED